MSSHFSTDLASASARRANSRTEYGARALTKTPKRSTWSRVRASQSLAALVFRKKRKLLTQIPPSAVFGNIRDLRSKSSKIRVSCIDLQDPRFKEGEGAKCSDRINGKSIGGYAFGTSKEYHDNTVVFCSPFFAPGQEHLDEVETNLKKDKNKQKDPNEMWSKAAILVHELSHLPAIAEQPEGASRTIPPVRRIVSRILLTTA